MDVISKQSQYVWELLSPADFEKLVFFLLDDMGFKNIEWRKDGEGISSTDGGRDLEATFTRIEPGDIVELEKWWVEVKYRSGNLAPATVKESILNAAGREGIEVFAIFTTGTISNNTWDWIKEFQSSQSKPKIRVWQRHDIERVLKKYPQTASRFFLASLSLSEKVQAVENRFWNSVSLPTLDEIDEIWKSYSDIQWSGSNFLPFVVAEISAGYPEFRQWGFSVSELIVLEAFVVGLANLPQLVVRFNQTGRSSMPLYEGLAYLLEIALLSFDVDRTYNICVNPYQFMDVDFDTPNDLLNF